MQYNNLIPEIRKAFPEIKKAVNQELDDWKNEEYPTGLIFTHVVIQFIKDELNKENNAELLKRIFAFLEKMAKSRDFEVQTALGVNVLENIGDNKNDLTKARSFMGEKTLKMSHEIEKGWGREMPDHPEFIQEIAAAIKELKQELNNRQHGIPGEGTVAQLGIIIRELILLENSIKIGDLPPKNKRDLSLTWFIKDSWSDSSVLGDKLLSLAHKYKHDLD
jgi:hypothetical protein